MVGGDYYTSFHARRIGGVLLMIILDLHLFSTDDSPPDVTSFNIHGKSFIGFYLATDSTQLSHVRHTLCSINTE